MPATEEMHGIFEVWRLSESRLLGNSPEAFFMSVCVIIELSGANTVPKIKIPVFLEKQIRTTGGILPAFDLFDLLCPFRISVILKLELYGVYDFFSGLVVELIKRCK